MEFNIKKILAAFMLCFTFAAQANAISKEKEAGWTFMIYMESNDKLLYWALQNIFEMALAHKDNNIRILVQLHARRDKAWRYEISNGAARICDVVDFENDRVENIVNAMDWAATNYPAQHYGLIFWGHGFGILDPVYVENSNTHFPWQAESIHDEVLCESGLCPIRGFMFDFAEKKYITYEKSLSKHSWW